MEKQEIIEGNEAIVNLIGGKRVDDWVSGGFKYRQHDIPQWFPIKLSDPDMFGMKRTSYLGFNSQWDWLMEGCKYFDKLGIPKEPSDVRKKYEDWCDKIDRAVTEEAEWRSTNGHGGVDTITRDNFILAAKFGYNLATQDMRKECERLKGLLEKSVRAIWKLDRHAEGLNENDHWQQFCKDNNI